MSPPAPNSAAWHRHKALLAEARRELLISEGCCTPEEADVLTAHEIRHHERAAAQKDRR